MSLVETKNIATMLPNQQNDPFAWMNAPQQPQQQQQQRPPPQQQQQQYYPPQQGSYSSFSQAPQQQQSWPHQQQPPPPQSWPQPQQQQQQQPWNTSNSWDSFSAPATAAAPLQQKSSDWGSSDPWNAPPAQPWNTLSSSTVPPPVRTASWGADPFSQGNISSSRLNTSSNPFDVGNDDAGFFSSFAKPAQQQQQQQKEYAPPNAKTQRLLRVASMLFERGAIIRADKIFLQDLLLKQDKRAENALDLAENDGNTDAINRLLYNERSGIQGDDEADRSVNMAREAMAKRPSTANRNPARYSDDDEEQTEALPVATYSNEAPHPAAGGYSAPIPATMNLDTAKQQFTGQILVRVSSKMMFRKWKPCFFCIDRTRVVLYDDKSQWLNGTASPRMVIPLHECMWIAKPSVKKTYSLIDDGRRVYFSTIKENSPQVLYSVVAAGMPRPVAYSPAIESRVVAKFASHYPDEISSFAHAVYSVVLFRQREAKANAGKDGNSSRPAVARSASGFAGRN